MSTSGGPAPHSDPAGPDPVPADAAPPDPTMQAPDAGMAADPAAPSDGSWGPPGDTATDVPAPAPPAADLGAPSWPPQQPSGSGPVPQWAPQDTGGQWAPGAPQQGGQYPAGQYPAAQYPPAQYPAAQYPAAQYPAAQYPAAQYPAAQYPAAQYPGSPYPTQQYPGQQQWAPQDTGQQYAGQQYPGQQYSGQQQWAPQDTGQQWTGQQWAGPPGAGPPGAPPPGGRGRLVALLVIGVIVLAGLGVGTFLLIRGTTSGDPPPPAATAAPAPPPVQTVRTPFLTYDVPADWDTSGAGGAPFALGVEFTGVAEAPGYDCGGARYIRGIANSALLEGTGSAAVVASEFAADLGRGYYTQQSGAEPEVSVGPARPVDVSGVDGVLVEATIRTPTDDGCLATEGTLLVLAVPTTGRGGGVATAILVVNGDVTGGPDVPPPPDRAALDAIVDSARLPSI